MLHCVESRDELLVSFDVTASIDLQKLLVTVNNKFTHKMKRMFLDFEVKRSKDNGLHFKVYRKTIIVNESNYSAQHKMTAFNSV
jgi:hypothetical protein